MWKLLELLDHLPNRLRRELFLASGCQRRCCSAGGTIAIRPRSEPVRLHQKHAPLLVCHQERLEPKFWQAIANRFCEYSLWSVKKSRGLELNASHCINDKRYNRRASNLSCYQIPRISWKPPAGVPTQASWVRGDALRILKPRRVRCLGFQAHHHQGDQDDKGSAENLHVRGM